MVKKLLKKICSGVGMGCFVFVAVLFIAPVLRAAQTLSLRQERVRNGSLARSALS